MEGDTGMADRIAADVSGLALAVMTNRALILAGETEDRVRKLVSFMSF